MPVNDAGAGFPCHVISNDRIKSNPDKTKPVSKMPAPQDRAQLRTFLGMISYMGSFIPNCGELEAPLLMITSNKRSFLWTPKRFHCFKELKRLLFTVLLLQYPWQDRLYQMETDASNQTIGRVLRVKLTKGFSSLLYTSLTNYSLPSSVMPFMKSNSFP